MAQAKEPVWADFHAATSGDDANPGTKEEPFATLQRARDAVRAARENVGHRDSATVWLRGGNYFLSETLRLDDRDSGIVFRAVEGEEPVVYGGTRVTGWEKWKGDIYRAKVPAGTRFFQLVHGRRAAVMARHPNKGSGYSGGFQKRNNTTIGIPQAFRGADYSDAQVFGFLGANWFSEMREVIAHQGDHLTVDSGSNAFGGLNDRIYVRGVLDFLDEPGEWCLKHKEGYVYYWPYPGADGNPAGLGDEDILVAPCTERIVEVKGRSPETPAENIRFEGITFIGSDFSARWWLFTPGADGSTPEPMQDGLIYGENVRRLTVSACRILHAGHSGVWLNNWAQECLIENCWIEGAGFAGVYMNSYEPGKAPCNTAAEAYVNKKHHILNNFIYDCGRFVGAGCGIQFFQSGENEIVHNRIAKMPRYGISYKGNRFGILPGTLYGEPKTFENHFEVLHTRDNRIAYNDISNVCRDSFDFGGIEAWGPGRDNVWEYNAVHDIDQTVEWNGWAHGLFTDDGTHYHTLRGNIVYEIQGGASTGCVMAKSGGEVIENNIFADNVVAWVFTVGKYIEPAFDMIIRRNIVLGAVPKIYSGPPIQRTWEGKPEFKQVDQNIFWPAPSNLAATRAAGWDRNAVVVDPRFATRNPPWNRTHQDYRLPADSPVLKAGFQPIAVDRIGLRDGFPFDRSEMFCKPAWEEIEAEDYDRMHGLRTIGGHGIHHMAPGAWAKYVNVDFAEGGWRSVRVAAQWGATGAERALFVRRYGKDLVRAVEMSGSTTPEAIPVWEVSPVYTSQGKAGPKLLPVPFAPETRPDSVPWRPFTGPTTDRSGRSSAPGVVDLDVFNGEGNEDGCAYMRASIHTQTGRTNADLRMETPAGARVWLNGEMILDGVQNPDESILVELKTGWNTFLVKVVQSPEGDRPFTAKVGVVNSSCGQVQVLPGLPSAETDSATGDAAIEIRLNAPNGKLIGVVSRGQREAEVEPLRGRHTLFLVFRRDCLLDSFVFLRANEDE